MTFASAMCVALLLDVAIGWPDWLFKRIGHPVSWIGRMISKAESLTNEDRRSDGARFVLGLLITFVVVAVATTIAWAIVANLPAGWLGIALTGVLAWPFIAARSLHEHVAQIAAPLIAGDIEGARQAVSMIVGRSPNSMDGPGIARAAIESLAENASDGVIAPLFWGLLLGLPGIVAYKTINTMDSMIGYRNARYLYFGRAAARLDDLVNLLPARITGFLLAVVSGRSGYAVTTVFRDSGKHRSPNAGWPEAAMAAGLGVRVSGPRMYDGVVTEDAWVNEGAPDPTGDDILQGLVLYNRAIILFAVFMFILAGTSG